MIKLIEPEEAIKIIKANYGNSGLAITVLWNAEKEPMMNKIKLLNNTYGSKFKLKTKCNKRGIMGVRNDIVHEQKKEKRLITFICVPKEHVEAYEQEIPDDNEAQIYIVI